jgi:maleate isomerase
VSDWNCKLGYVVPSWNTVVEYETMRMLPPSVSAHFARISHTEDSPASMQYMTDQFPTQVELLSHAGVDAVCYACTGASLARGYAVDQDDIARLQRSGGPAIISTAGALVDAARHLKLSRVAVAAPYEPWLLAHLIDYLKAAGLDVLNAVGLGEQANVKHGPDAALALAQRAWVADADGLVLSCGNFRSLEAIPQIERHIGKPLLTSNGCALWSALTVSGWRGAAPGGGHLLQQLAPR